MKSKVLDDVIGAKNLKYSKNLKIVNSFSLGNHVMTAPDKYMAYTKILLRAIIRKSNYNRTKFTTLCDFIVYFNRIISLQYHLSNSCTVYHTLKKMLVHQRMLSFYHIVQVDVHSSIKSVETK